MAREGQWFLFFLRCLWLNLFPLSSSLYAFISSIVLNCNLNAGEKLKEARQSAGAFVGEVTKDAKSNVADVAERVGSMVKSRWAVLQLPSTRHAVQDRLITAAATTGTLLRRSLSGTKDKVAVGKTKVEEVISIKVFLSVKGLHSDLYWLVDFSSLEFTFSLLDM